MLAGLFRLLFSGLIILLGAGLILMGIFGLPVFGPVTGWNAISGPEIWGEQPGAVAASPAAASPFSISAAPEAPARLAIPAIELDAPVVPAVEGSAELGRRSYLSWEAPGAFAAGWHGDSARLGEAGNVVLNGHHNVSGQVFARLIDLKEGDEILVYGESLAFRYRVTEIHLLPEKGQPRKVRLANARWIQPTPEARLTLVTCWPYETNTHRLIIVAKPE